MKLLSQYRCIGMSSSLGDNCKSNSLKSSSHSNKESESTMLLSATTHTLNDCEDISRSDETTAKALNRDPAKDSDLCSDKAAALAAVLCCDTAPNKTNISESNNTDEIVTNKSIETTATVNHESAIAATSSEGNNNEMVLTFPQRLMEMLDDPQNSEMMAWLPHGRAFAIYRKREFATDVLPKYFQKAAKYSSFTRKLNRWGFVRVTRGPETGAYYHQLFRRNERRLVLQMTCHTSTTTNIVNPNIPTGPSMVATVSKRVSGSSHVSAENDSMAMMMMYPNYLDPAASQYMYHQNQYAGPRPQQHPSQYPQMGPQQHHYYGNNIAPYNMYEETPIDGMIHDEGQYYPPAMGGVYPNHYAMPPPHASFSDSYVQAPFHDSNMYSNKNEHNMPPLATQQHFHDDAIRQTRRTSGMSERAEPSSRTTSMVATAEDDGLRVQSYTTNNESSKSNYRMMQKGIPSSFRPAGKHDSAYHHHAPGYGNDYDDTMLYHASSQLYDHSGAKADRAAPQEHDLMDHSLYSPAVRQTSSYNHSTQPPPPPHSSTTGETNY